MIDEILPDALHGERLDRVVAMLDGCSRSVAAALIADGKVAIDGDPVTQRSIRVTAGQHIVFAPTVVEVVVLEADLEVEFEVVYSDEHVIVVNKPAGLIVHPGAGRPDKTLVNGLLARFPEIDGVGQDGRPKSMEWAKTVAPASCIDSTAKLVVCSLSPARPRPTTF